MKVLLDNCTPNPLRRYLTGHTVHHCAELGWASLENGELLAVAETEGFDLFITCDRNLRYQQNMSGRRLAILELGVQLWPRLEPLAGLVQAQISGMLPGQYKILFDS